MTVLEKLKSLPDDQFAIWITQSEVAIYKQIERRAGIRIDFDFLQNYAENYKWLKEEFKGDK